MEAGAVPDMISDLDLLAAIKEETSEAFVIFGELGRDKNAARALLALDRATNALVLLVVSATTGSHGEVDLGIEVRTELDALIPAARTLCLSCGSGLRALAHFCPNCGADVLGQSGASDADPDDMRAAVEGSIPDDYELLGEMPRTAGGGRVYFAREKLSGAVAALRLNRGTTDGEFELVETQAI